MAAGGQGLILPHEVWTNPLSDGSSDGVPETLTVAAPTVSDEIGLPVVGRAGHVVANEVIHRG